MKTYEHRLTFVTKCLIIKMNETRFISNYIINNYKFILKQNKNIKIKHDKRFHNIFKKI